MVTEDRLKMINYQISDAKDTSEEDGTFALWQALQLAQESGANINVDVTDGDDSAVALEVNGHVFHFRAKYAGEAANYP